MKSLLLLAVFLFYSGACMAEPVLFGKRLVSQGDAASHVLQVAGAPDKIDKIPGDGSSPPMEIWTYRRKENVIVLFVVDEKVVHTQERPAESHVAGEDASKDDKRTASR